MKYVDEDKLPVEVKDNKLPDSDGKYKMFYNPRIRTSGGFTDAMLLSAIMVSMLMWGLLIILLIKQG